MKDMQFIRNLSGTIPFVDCACDECRPRTFVLVPATAARPAMKGAVIGRLERA